MNNFDFAQSGSGATGEGGLGGVVTTSCPQG